MFQVCFRVLLHFALVYHSTVSLALLSTNKGMLTTSPSTTISPKQIDAISVCSRDALLNDLLHQRRRSSRGKSSILNIIVANGVSTCSTSSSSSSLKEIVSPLRRQVAGEILNLAGPAFLSLLSEPAIALIDTIYMGRLGSIEQAAIGLANSAHYSLSKLYNDPLLRSSTSLVAGKEGEELQASIASAVLTAGIIGIIQSIVFVFAGKYVLQAMGANHEVMAPAMQYLRYRSLGIPASTVQLVINGIFRGRGDTKSPLYCTLLGNMINIVVNPIFIFSLSMGCAGAGLATSIGQWAVVIPLLYLLQQRITRLKFTWDWQFYSKAFSSYWTAGSMIFLRTLAKVLTYSLASSAASQLGTMSLAAFSITFNLGSTAAQMCESIAVAAQSLLAREYPFTSIHQQVKAKEIVKQVSIIGILISCALTGFTWFNQASILSRLSGNNGEVLALATSLMPFVLLTQLLKGLMYPSAGILLGGLDWGYSSLALQIATCVSVIVLRSLPLSLQSIWIALSTFMAIQVCVLTLLVCC